MPINECFCKCVVVIVAAAAVMIFTIFDKRKEFFFSFSLLLVKCQQNQLEIMIIDMRSIKNHNRALAHFNANV